MEVVISGIEEIERDGISYGSVRDHGADRPRGFWSRHSRQSQIREEKVHPPSSLLFIPLMFDFAPTDSFLWDLQVRIEEDQARAADRAMSEICSSRGLITFLLLLIVLHLIAFSSLNN